MFLGRANTNGDVVVWLPEEKIIATGDIVVRPTPYGFGSHPKEWVEVLNHIKALDYVALVPGHGEVQTDTAYLDLLIELLNAVVERTKAAVDAGAADMDVVREAVDLSDFDERFTGGDPLLEALFNSWFKRPIVGGAYQDLTEAE
jgi:glyoxylase-like metal-dependent hydrolase (beta-lactamase superfamily II)